MDLAPGFPVRIGWAHPKISRSVQKGKNFQGWAQLSSEWAEPTPGVATSDEALLRCMSRSVRDGF